jgi:hypothetical protein
MFQQQFLPIVTIEITPPHVDVVVRTLPSSTWGANFQKKRGPLDSIIMRSVDSGITHPHQRDVINPTQLYCFHPFFGNLWSHHFAQPFQHNHQEVLRRCRHCIKSQAFT